ncbi:MAG: transcriptional repressor [Chlamydiota bacterium]
MKQDQKLRITRQRQLILEELRKVVTHPTADELYRMVRERIPRVSLGTVYRNLETLSGRGVILKLELAGTQRRYDATTANHYHIRCNKCGCVEDLSMKAFDNIEGEARGATQFTITGHKLEFEGMCPRCAKTAH